MLYSSLLKRGTTCVLDEKTCIVDANEIIAKKLEEFERSREEQLKGGFKAGLQAQELEVLCDDTYDPVNAVVDEKPHEPEPAPEALIAEAREQISKMEEEAKATLEAERRRVLEEARKEGYSQGYAEGQRQGLSQVDGMKRELESEKTAIIADYNKRIEELEPQFIDTLTGIYEYLFKVEIGEYRDIIIHLISASLNQIEGTRNYLVHVSKDDFAYVNMQKKEIQDNAAVGNAAIEIVEDISLRKNECLIETDGGIFDCGLGTQLSELTRRLKLLSYEKE